MKHEKQDKGERGETKGMGVEFITILMSLMKL